MFRDVDPKTALELTRDQHYAYIDVRTVPEFEEGHPPGAYNIPAFLPGPGGMQPNPEFLQVVRAHFEPDDKLVLGCAAGARSARACELLAQVGFDAVVNCAGGFSSPSGWRNAGLPVSTEADGRDYASLRAKGS